MKIKIKALLQRLIMWAAGDYFAETLKQHLVTLTTTTHAARDHLAKENAKQWRLLDSKISALQAIDAPFGKDIGKAVIVARVRGQDIVKIIDIPPNMEARDFKDMVDFLQGRYGARPEFLDAPAGKRTFMAEYLGMPDAATLRAAARDRGFVQ